MKENNSRRRFIRGAALTGLATCCLPAFETFAAKSGKVPGAKDGAVILFQGDSITDGNRGRNTDPNHIMGHGYAFSIASRVGADYPEKKYIFYNRGISGNRTTELENRWQTDTCLLYTSDAADEEDSVDLGGRRIIKKK